MTIHFKDTEALHKRMYAVHLELVSGAEKLHAALVEITAAGRHTEDRRSTAKIVELLAVARDLADQAWQTAANARSEIIRLTGCSGTCRD